VGEQGAAQECGRMDHDDSPLLGGSFWGRGQRCSSDRSRRISRIGQSALPTLFSIVCTCTNTKTPVSCTNGCGMFSERASNQVVRLTTQGITAATRRNRESISMGHLLCPKMIQPVICFDYLGRNGMGEI